jgi:hypothetical protein
MIFIEDHNVTVKCKNSGPGLRQAHMVGIKPVN